MTTEEQQKKPVLAISTGDLNGIGPEVIIKTFADQRILNYCTPVIFASNPVIAYHKNPLNNIRFNFNLAKRPDRFEEGKVNLYPVWNDRVNMMLGHPSEEVAEYTYLSLEKAATAVIDGYADALVTAPVNKKILQSAGFNFPGHTEYLASLFSDKMPLMFFLSEELKLACCTGHLPLKDVAGSITRDLVKEKIRLLNDSLQQDFLIEKPRIAVLGLNPHAGEEGLLGEEEKNVIEPAIEDCKNENMLVMGPYPADGFFGSKMYAKFDATLAMFHDQGLAPFKLLAFGEGVNYTAGLPMVRTSPDHGTGYGIAGKDQADPASFRNAVLKACRIIHNRKISFDISANPLQTRMKKQKEAL
jgi:4-hydroxythreonine-4-phosphate dehydrogenase